MYQNDGNEVFRTTDSNKFSWKSYVTYGLIWGINIFLFVAAINSIRTFLGYKPNKSIIMTYFDLIPYTTFNYFDDVFRYMAVSYPYLLLIMSIFLVIFITYCLQRGIPCLESFKVSMKVIIIGCIGSLLLVIGADYIMTNLPDYLPSKEEFGESISQIQNNLFYMISYLLVSCFILGKSIMLIIRTLSLIIGFFISPLVMMMGVHQRAKKIVNHFISDHCQNGWQLLLDCTIPYFFLWGITKSINEGWNPLYLILGIVVLELLYNLVRYTINNIRQNFTIEEYENGGINNE